MNYVLETVGLTKAFDGFVALLDLNLQVQPGTLHAVIGPNGAGKTTLFNLLAGRLRPTRGEIYLNGRRITRLPAWRVARLGVGRAFQINNLFPQLTALENLRLAVQAKIAGGGGVVKGATERSNRRATDGANSDANLGATGSFAGLVPPAWQWWRPAARFTAIENEACRLLDLVGLAHRAATPAHALAHGDQRKLELGLALAGRPQLLLLDEPTAGMAREEVPAVLELIRRIREQADHTILLVEHKMDVILALADRITVLSGGQHLATGTPAEIMADPRVREAYLGRPAERRLGSQVQATPRARAVPQAQPGAQQGPQEPEEAHRHASA